MRHFFWNLLVFVIVALVVSLAIVRSQWKKIVPSRASEATCDNGVKVGETACQNQGDLYLFVCKKPNPNQVWERRECLNGQKCIGATCQKPPEKINCKNTGEECKFFNQQSSCCDAGDKCKANSIGVFVCMGTCVNNGDYCGDGITKDLKCCDSSAQCKRTGIFRKKCLR